MHDYHSIFDTAKAKVLATGLSVYVVAKDHIGRAVEFEFRPTMSGRTIVMAGFYRNGHFVTERVSMACALDIAEKDQIKVMGIE